MAPNPSLERDLHRHGTWPASRSGTSSVQRAKHHAGSGPSAQTLGRTGGYVASSRDRFIQRALARRTGANVALELRGRGGNSRSAFAGGANRILPSVGAAAEQGSTGSVGPAITWLHRRLQRVGQSVVCSARLPAARRRESAVAVGQTELQREPLAVHLQEEPGRPGVL